MTWLKLALLAFALVGCSGRITLEHGTEPVTISVGKDRGRDSGEDERAQRRRPARVRSVPCPPC
jgi:hypothetical protein